MMNHRYDGNIVDRTCDDVIVIDGTSSSVMCTLVNRLRAPFPGDRAR